MSTRNPNILVAWGDDNGITNLSGYSEGLMGYRTPTIDRIATEGMRFTDSYGDQSCTAGRASSITGQSAYRTGLSKVGMPALDEFFGNFYPLNTEDEPENPNYPTAEEAPRLRAMMLQRGIHSWATEEASDEVDERYGPVGRQRIDDTGPLTRKRMETIDDETTSAAIDFIERQHESDTPLFVWMNTTDMHFRTHTKPESVGQSGRWQSEYHDTLIDHDGHLGRLLDCIDELGITDDTIVVYSTDNGPHANTWPDDATTPFRSEKNTGREGAFRVPETIRRPGRIPAGLVSNEIVQQHDWLSIFLAAAGEPDIVTKLEQGHSIRDRSYHGHIDGYELLICLSDDCEVLGLRSRTGRSSFSSSAVRGRCNSGSNPSPNCAHPRSSTRAPTLSSGPKSPPTATGTGCWRTSSRSSRHAANRCTSPLPPRSRK